MNINVYCGNFGAIKKEFPVISAYKNHFLFFDGCLKIANRKGLILFSNRLNAFLPKISQDSFIDWVDWAMSLPDDMNNLLDRKADFSGSAPSGTLFNCR